MNPIDKFQLMKEEELRCEKLRFEIRALRDGQRAWPQRLQPFVLLLATAAVSGLLIPYITGRSQVSEKELDLKTALTTDISRSVSALVHEIQWLEVQKVNTAGKGHRFDEVNTAYKQWKADEGVYSAKIRAYFPQLGGDWRQFAEAVEELYALTGTTGIEFRKPKIEVLKRYVNSDEVDWDVLMADSREWRTAQQWRPYEQAWGKLRDQVLGARDRILSQLLRSKSTLS